MLNRVLVLLSVVLLVSGLASAVIIAPVNNPDVGFTLAEAIEAQGIRVGDKLFDKFVVSTSKSADAAAPGASAITIHGVLINGEYGLRFNGGWTASGGQVADTTLLFRVSAAKPWLIHDNSLWMDAYGAVNGGMVAITENVYASNPLMGFTPSLADKYVYYINRNNKQIYDHQEFTDAEGNPQALAHIWVVKDIVVSGGRAGVASLSQFYQTFSQIPEPATMSLLAMGGLALIRRRRSRS